MSTKHPHCERCGQLESQAEAMMRATGSVDARYTDGDHEATWTRADSWLWAYHDYLGVADELSEPSMTLDDLDPEYVATARRFAETMGVPFPIDSIDLADEHVREAIRLTGALR